MARVSVVGSGASGVHFALTLLRKGHEVTMVDVGRDGPPAVKPEAGFNDLKDSLDDPTEYFLGSRFEGVLLPDFDQEYYGIPPGKSYVFESVPGFRYSASGFAPLFSFAQGGLAQTWTAGCYPLNDGELEAFPFSYAELGPCYGEVARRIGVTGEEDDLARFMPLHDHLLQPLELDRHSRLLMELYGRKRERLNRGGCYVGRTRVATLSRDHGGRKGCAYLGRCLWGCPVEALYTPSLTLRECMAHEGFTYVSGVRVLRFRFTGRRATHLVVEPIDGGAEQELAVDRLALAAGALFSSQIVLASVLAGTGEQVHLRGLMDNRQVLLPFVNLRMVGKQYIPDTYQYHLLGMGLDGPDPRDYIHGQITTLKTALMHPIIQQLPFDLKTSTFLARTMHAALGVINVNFRDTRRDENEMTLEPDESGGQPRLVIRYRPSPDEPERMRTALGRVVRALRSLGCIVPPGMAHVRPIGASVHYAGTFPMSSEAASWTTTPECRSREFENLFLVDGATFPFLPAKNITFTLMANAVRVAETAF